MTVKLRDLKRGNKFKIHADDDAVMVVGDKDLYSQYPRDHRVFAYIDGKDYGGYGPSYSNMEQLNPETQVHTV